MSLWTFRVYRISDGRYSFHFTTGRYRKATTKALSVFRSAQHTQSLPKLQKRIINFFTMYKKALLLRFCRACTRHCTVNVLHSNHQGASKCKWSVEKIRDFSTEKEHISHTHTHHRTLYTIWSTKSITELPSNCLLWHFIRNGISK